MKKLNCRDEKVKTFSLRGKEANAGLIRMAPERSEKNNVRAVSRYYTLLRDPARRKIIEILGSQSKIGFKELRQELKLGVGTVYYHLDMLSDFLTQDKHRKYMLNDRGRLLHRLLRDGSLPPTLEIGEAFSHRLGRWLFLSPVFAKTVRPLRLLPVSVLILALGAVGAALASVDPMLFFYFPFSGYGFETIATLFLSNWIGLFLVSNFLIYMLYRRAGGNLQLFTCIGIAAFPLALFPYVYMFVSYDVARYLLLAIQIWSLLLISSALCFGKGLRLDKGIVVSLTILYLNVMLLVILGRLI
ncbi:MAG: winged helix-turn-helix domain-containing protein [Candidatus Bathyarchaeota archaeon]|nr:winged helix-turn-helix domain-containing protein [Candidatus Bathyarchaeota archaeon]